MHMLVHMYMHVRTHVLFLITFYKLKEMSVGYVVDISSQFIFVEM